MVSTNYSKQSKVSTGYGIPTTDFTSELLLQSGDLLLLQIGEGNILFESGEVTSANYAKSSIGPSLNYEAVFVGFLLLQGALDYLLLQDGVAKLGLEDIEGKATNYARPSVNATNYTKI